MPFHPDGNWFWPVRMQVAGGVPFLTDYGYS
jgi:hypothetical protein